MKAFITSHSICALSLHGSVCLVFPGSKFAPSSFVCMQLLMAPKPAQDAVAKLRRTGKSKEEARRWLQAHDYSKSRISQLLKDYHTLPGDAGQSKLSNSLNQSDDEGGQEKRPCKTKVWDPDGSTDEAFAGNLMSGASATPQEQTR